MAPHLDQHKQHEKANPRDKLRIDKSQLHRMSEAEDQLVLSKHKRPVEGHPWKLLYMNTSAVVALEQVRAH